MAGEFDFIDWIRSQTPAHPRIVIPPGDDLAALKWDASDLVLAGADQVLDGVHFSSAIHSPRDIGRKAMNRNLSDCAAMACLPAAAIATVAVPKGTSIDYAKELFLGMKAAGDKFDCPIVGGDTGSWDGRLAISVAILGRTAGIRHITRRGALPGDNIYVSGPLGGSLLGRHMAFEPRVLEARMLAALNLDPQQGDPAHAMIDISDGVSSDLPHICRESGVGAIVHANAVPVHEDAVAMRRDGRSPLEHALHDGEDYELLYAMPGMPVHQATLPSDSDHVSQNWIGVFTAEPGIFLQHPDGRREPLEPKAWEHRF